MPNLKKAEDVNGRFESKVLPQDVKNYLIHTEETITKNDPNKEPERMVTCKPFPDALATLYKWSDEGHIITFFTSRTVEQREVTETWLNKHGFKYHGALFGKPRGGNYHWIDNHFVKATRYNGKSTDLMTIEKEIQVFKNER